MQADSQRSEALALDQLGRILHAANRWALNPPTVEELFTARCNDTPVTTEILRDVLIKLRDHRDIELVGADGRMKPRAKTVAWDDRLRLPAERSLFALV